ncbi:MAG: CocE/NonD family hydrolase [Bacteroidales bacterium]|nr:CocE/NonD family hydrolase [Bacteroidales bacterium]
MKRILATLSAILIPLLSGAQMGFDSSGITVPDDHAFTFTDTLVAGGGGFNLSTQLYIPEGEGPWPTVVIRSPYLPASYKDAFPQAKEYAKRGVAYVVQRCRGTGGSEGTYEPNIYEREDGLALLSWLQNEKWCKNIVLTGASYMALTCWIVADSLPDKVKGIYLHHYGVDRYLSAYSSGMFRQDILTSWAIDNAKENIRRPSKSDPMRVYFDELFYRPQVDMAKDKLGADLPWYRDWITHTEYTDPYWHEGVWETLRSIPPKIKVPMTIVAGHFDHHMEGTILGYDMLPEETKAKSRLIVGAWNHSYQTTPTFGKTAHAKDFNLDADTFNWIYSLLVEGKEPVQEVKVYAVGADQWMTLKQWPGQGDVFPMYLDAVGETDIKSLSLKAGKNSSVEYDYDPSDPVLSVGGETLFTSEARRGSRQQPEPLYRPDVKTFISGPLLSSFVISGSVKATIYVSSDAEDTAFTFRISEVLPDGKAYNIRSGIATLAFREDRLGSRGTYTPGQIVPVTITTNPILWRLGEGSRIRVDISSSDFPQYSVHPNYPGVWSEIGQTKVAHQKIYTGKKYPSHIDLPDLYSTLATVSSGDMNEEELVNIGYGDINKKGLTSSVSSLKINKDDIATYSTIFDYIKGRVPGVQVMGSGRDAKVIIRGISTVNGSNDPLILVDGNQTDDISWITPTSVKSVEVLKDAASCAIYGVQGANGVILITTIKPGER